MKISGEVNDGGIEQALNAMASEIDALADQVVWRTGSRLKTQVRANASTGTHLPGDPHIPGTGPGPNVATGDYHRSIGSERGRDAQGPFSIVSSNAPQAFRLEYGYVGTDSMGRNYTQPPYPHWRPAAKQADEFLEAEMVRALGKVLRRLS